MGASIRWICGVATFMVVLFIPLRSHALPPEEKIVVVDTKIVEVMTAELKWRRASSHKGYYCRREAPEYEALCRQYTQSAPELQDAYTKAISGFGRLLTACENQWTGFQSKKAFAETLLSTAKDISSSSSGREEALKLMTRADVQMKFARQEYEQFKQDGCVVMTKDDAGNIVPLRPGSPFKEWS